jgi:propane monooxygenase reductase subunit
MKVRFEPIGEEIECASDETVLDAAFRQGYNLVYGCREGQCSACKCFLLEGDVALKRHSSFALSDSERTNGYALMCRAMPEQDLVIELLHYDPAAYRLDHAISDGTATVEAVEELTHDIVRVVLRAPGFAFTPGQYVDLHVPGADGVKRSFSMANVPGEDRIELIIKRYPGGKLSGMLGGQIASGHEIAFTGPYGSFRLRDSARPILMLAGGSGMAPILSVLRQLAQDGCERPVRFFYGARTDADLFYGDEVRALGERLGDFAFQPVVERFVHEAVDEWLGSEAGNGFAEPDVYMCGPPPMIEAAEDMLVEKHGVDERRIFMDKFTTSADAPPPTHAESASAAPPTDGAGAESERDFAWYSPAGRRATLYEDVTVDTQPSVHRHLTRGWPVMFEDGRGTWDDGSTALRSDDWFAFRDPGEQWERPFYQRGSAVEQQIEGAIRSARGEGLMRDYSPEWVEFLREWLQVPAYVEHGLWFALATAARDCLSDTVATCVCLEAAMKQRSAQSIVLYAMDLEQHHGPFPIEAAREAFLADERWQPTRRYLERLAATPDWGEVVVAANLCFEPVVGTLVRRELGTRAAAASGDIVTPVLARAATEEWEWTRSWTTELVGFLLGGERFGARNRDVIEGWVGDWLPQAMAAAHAIADGGFPVDVDRSRIGEYAARVLSDAGLPELASVVGVAPSDRPEATQPPRARRVRRDQKRTRRSASPAVSPDGASATAPSPGADGSYDFVGIVMAKSAEGDAVAEILARRDDVEVISQPAFWDIRARDRLEIPFAAVSEELGYAIGAYSIQHEMSTHYGRMVTTDDALMLFSDPTDAMQYLMS